ncbi:hypothetical protein JL101_026845 [Skermanella rosea]|uniref:hypothetical protein n=1 Tax=Skermanella rosea TaxID=1817965 RepID=UPI001933F308|nr:hypothetical protein [Skermanella rosea]UEM03528.1 hypothetical protein JL101_026845 [Skermanella rosea]
MLSHHDLEDFMGIDAALDENAGTAAGGKGRISPGRVGDATDDDPAEHEPD